MARVSTGSSTAHFTTKSREGDEVWEGSEVKAGTRDPFPRHWSRQDKVSVKVRIYCYGGAEL